MTASIVDAIPFSLEGCARVLRAWGKQTKELYCALLRSEVQFISFPKVVNTMKISRGREPACTCSSGDEGATERGHKSLRKFCSEGKTRGKTRVGRI